MKWPSSLDVKVVKLPVVVFTIVAPVIAVIFGNIVTALVFVLAGLVALLWVRAEDITEVRFLSLQAKLEKSITEANATVSQLRGLASVLAGPVVAQIALGGQFMKHQTLASKQRNINEIAQYLKGIGAKASEIQDVMTPWKLLACPSVLHMILARLEEVDFKKLEEFSELLANNHEVPKEVVKLFKRLPEDARLAALQKVYVQIWKVGWVDDPSILEETIRPKQLPSQG
jgi:hypothetical protein